jgi:hypothetical protein
LNEQERVKEKEEVEARQKARKQERLARREADQKVYEITLKQADQPGLPPPLAKTNSLLAKTIQGGTVVGASTNSVSLASAAPPKTGDLDDELEDAVPAVDAALDEAEHILVDYVALLSKQVTATNN